MHTEAQLRQAAANARVKVLSIRYVDSPEGPLCVGTFDTGDNEGAFRLLCEFAVDDVGDAVARSIGLNVHQRFAPDEARMAQAIQSYVKKNVAYLPEPVETFQAPWYTLKLGVGDCDDHANLVHAVARNAGLKARIVPVRDKQGRIRHACAQMLVDGVWSWVETTLDADFDEAPKAAANRLKATSRSDISGIEGAAMTTVLTGATIPLRHGVRYRARARVDAPKALTPSSTIAHLFEDSGFTGVTVYTDASTLPADWPGDQREEIQGGALGGWTAFIEGTWNLSDQGIPRPEPLLAVWQADQVVEPTSSGSGVVTLPEVVVVGTVPPKPLDWRVGALAVATAGAVLVSIALRFGHPEP